MRRRLQTHEHTDCTSRGILGRRNRYALAAQTITGTPVVGNRDPHADSVIGHAAAFRFLCSIPTIRSIDINLETSVGIGNPACKAPESGNGRAFPFYLTGAGPVSSAYLIKRVTYPCPAPVFDSLGLNHGKSFLFCSGNTRIYNITTRSRAERSGANHDAFAVQSGAAALRNAVRRSALRPTVGNPGTPAANKSEHDNLRFFCGGSFPFPICTRPADRSSQMIPCCKKQQRSVAAFSSSGTFAFDENVPMHDSHSWGQLDPSGRESCSLFDNLR